MINKKFISRIIVLVLLLSIILPMEKSFTDSLDNIEISVYINDDGSANITERRTSYLTEGTENYIVIKNLGDSEIENFKVWENGVLYDYIEDWDISASREEKTYKNGIIDTGDGYELAWGIGEYGEHDYELQYTITNFVKQFQDRQGIFWRFINDELTSPPENAKVVIESDRDFLDTNSGIWSFGFPGEINFRDGLIEATSSQAFNSYNYLTILVELEDGMFNTSSALINQPFEEIKERAFEGSDYSLEDNVYNDDDGYTDDPYINNSYYDRRVPGFGRGIFGFMSVIMSLIPMIFIFIIFTLIKRSNKVKNDSKKYKGEYYRDYPYEGDFHDIYYMLQKAGLSNRENLITGFILKWINKDYISLGKEEVGFIFKKEETALTLLKTQIEGSIVERELYDMMLEAAGPNNVLESNEFTKWSRRNYREVERWEKSVVDYSSKKLEELRYVNLEEKKILFFTTHDIQFTEKGEDLRANVYKFINYLKDFSLLNEHEAINIGIWDNLMIWAGVLGVTEAVAKEFEKLYPNYEEESVYRGSSHIYMINAFSRSASNAVSSAGSSSRSSGGGGFSSSGGGGGGSFGGGSGGGTR